jgi:lysophospholipase L1-like esterase
MTAPKNQKLSLAQAFLLSVVVPCVFLLALELGARGIELLLPQPSGPQALEMPTWMLQDANATRRPKVTKEDLEWLTLFTEGDGYRVRLLPNSSKEVRNTFSLIPVDRDKKRLIRSNSIGFRGPEISLEKQPGTVRILVFGDSSSFGWGVNTEESWPALLQQELQARHPGVLVEVANFAIPGDSSAYGRLLFDAFAPQYKPDFVILGFGANDAKPVVTSHTEQVARFRENQQALRAKSAFKKSALYRLLERSLAPSAGGSAMQATNPAVAPPDYADNLRYMADEARALGSKNTLFLTLCTPGNYAREARVTAKRMNRLSFNAQGQLIRLIPKIKRGEAYPEYLKVMQASYPAFLRRNDRFYVTSDGCHPNELGHRFVADQLTELVEASGLFGGGATALMSVQKPTSFR